MDSTAKAIRDKVVGASAVTLYGGYAMFMGGERVTFETARITNEKRNKDGRCTGLLATYADGSQLEFRWDPTRGGRYRVINPK